MSELEEALEALRAAEEKARAQVRHSCGTDWTNPASIRALADMLDRMREEGTIGGAPPSKP